MIYHMSALALGFALDLMIGDPYNIPHPIRWIGSLIAFLEKKMNAGKSPAVLKARGLILVIMVMIIPLKCLCGSCRRGGHNMLHAGG